MLAGFAAGLAAPPLTLAALGVFPGPQAVVFFAPVVTPSLLALHGAYHRRFAALDAACWPHYRPGS